MNASATSPATWSERYEALRRYVLEGAQRLESRPLGLSLWGAQGMAGWMDQWSKLAEAAPSRPQAPAPLPCSGCAAPGQEQLTLVLAQITLAHL